MNNRNPLRSNRQGGSVTLIIAFTMVIVIAFAGLAIDTGRHYGVKAQLSAAADAGAIAGARALAEGASQAERIANAEAAALRFFNLNYPDGFQNSSVNAPTIQVAPVGNGRWTVNVDAQANATTTFMRILGNNGSNIGTMAQAIRVNPDIMMVLDSSGSMGGQIGALQTAAKDGFVSKFIPEVDGDRLGVVNFASGSTLAEPINKTATRGFNKTSVDTAIDSLVAGGWTSTSDAMRRALDDLNAIPVAVRSDLRIMLVFSDGAPNMFALESGGQRANMSRQLNYFAADQINAGGPNLGLGTLPQFAVGNVPRAGRLPTNNTVDSCNVTRATRNLTENVAAMARQQGIVVYTIGLGNNLQGIEGTSAGLCGMGNDDIGANLLRRVANTDDQNPRFVANEPRGLFCFAAQADDLETCFSTIANDILRLTM